MKKKIISMVLATAMTATMLAGCGSSSTAETTDTATETTDESADAATEAPAADIDYGSGTITIWVAEEVADFTKEQAEKFIADNADYSGYTIDVQATGEGDAAGNMITDVEGGADIYGFAQDQLARLVSAGALTPLTGDYATFVTDNNDSGAAAAAAVADTTYAFPLTSDNGYFLYYDSSVVTDPTSLDAIVSDCESAGKSFYMEINSGWYQTAFFFGTGCKFTYDTDNDGNFTACNMDYASDNGVKALKAMVNLNKSKAFVNGSSLSSATNPGAIIDGTWDSSAAKDLFGDNYACAKLPKFTVDGEDFQMSGFGGYKMMGVKPQAEQGKMIVCLNLAEYLSSEDVQMARYESNGWGPSNVNAQNSDEVKSDVALSALAEQLVNTIPQGQYPGDYWTLATSLGDSVIAGDYNNATDDDLMSALTDFQTTCEGYAK